MQKDHKCSDEMFAVCTKNALCHLCDGQRLFKRPKWMDLKDREAQRKAEGIRKKPKEGMKFEKRVQKSYNKATGSDTSGSKRGSARRRPNSGAIWCMPGDIVTEAELIECKERGSQTSKGEKTYTIHKEQLEKIETEARLAKKEVGYLVFGFKGSIRSYAIKDYDAELQMIQQIQILKARIVELEKQLGVDTDAKS